tara:strand:- start:44290 stop:44691 length:402 start_codon:yes stop_codon:yes gene_type:complete
MTALTKDRNTNQRQGDEFNHPVAAGAHIYGGSIVVLDAARNAKPGLTATGLVAAGRAQEEVNNVGGSAGDKTVQVRKGVFSFANDGSIARVDIGGTAYIVDDQTVADTDGTGTRSAAGEIVDVDADGVWVKIG